MRWRMGKVSREWVSYPLADQYNRYHAIIMAIQLILVSFMIENTVPRIINMEIRSIEKIGKIDQQISKLVFDRWNFAKLISSSSTLCVGCCLSKLSNHINVIDMISHSNFEMMLTMLGYLLAIHVPSLSGRNSLSGPSKPWAWERERERERQLFLLDCCNNHHHHHDSYRPLRLIILIESGNELFIITLLLCILKTTAT